MMENENQGQETEQETPREVSEDPSAEDHLSLDLILDIPLQLTVELGSTQILVKDLLQLSHGSVIELSKTTGDPLELLVNNRPIARGEVVKVNENFGIRITEILSPAERVEQLK